MHRTGRARDSQIVEDDAREMRAIERDAADRHLAAETRFERRFNFPRNEIGKAVAADVPPTAADHQNQKEQKNDRSADEPPQAPKHRAAPLPLSRRTMLMPLGRPLFCVHSDFAAGVLTTSQPLLSQRYRTNRPAHRRYGGVTKHVSLVPMPRDLPISNGNLMINFDREYNIRDVYWPHVGQDNQTVGDISFFGVWCDGKFAWIGDPAWIKTLEYEPDTLVTRVVARAPSLDLEMLINDTVDFDRDLFVRRIEIRNLRP